MTQNSQLSQAKVADDFSAIAALFGQDGPGISCVGYEQTRSWHPRFRFRCFDVPQWLSAWKVCRFSGNGEDTSDMHNGVHSLYHKILDNHDDRMQISTAIGIGETFALVAPRSDPDGSFLLCVMGAITFLVTDTGAVLVL